jgi:hypothetical protein
VAVAFEDDPHAVILVDAEVEVDVGAHRLLAERRPARADSAAIAARPPLGTAAEPNQRHPLHNKVLDRRARRSYLVVSNKLAGTMRYTPSQVRSVVGITQETLRHWRRALPSLSGLKGHAPVFRPGQLLGLAVVRVLVEEVGLPVGALHSAERDIFAICSSPQWLRLAQGHLLVRPAEGQVIFVDRVSDSDLERPAILLPLEPIVTALRLALLEVAPEEAQQSITFPPLDVSERRAAGSGRP